MTKKLNALFGFITALSLLTGCSGTIPNHPKVTANPHAKIMWWGNAGDLKEWEKAKGIMENYDWVVMSQEIYNTK